LCAEFFEGNIDKSREIQLKVLDIIEAMFCEVNPIPIKTALNLMGKNVGPLRLPLVSPTKMSLEKIKSVMGEWELV